MHNPDVQSTSEEVLTIGKNEIIKLAKRRALQMIKEGNIIHFDKEKYVRSIKKEFPQHWELYLKKFMEVKDEKLPSMPRQELVRRLAVKRGADAAKRKAPFNAEQVSKLAKEYTPNEKIYFDAYKNAFDRKSEIKKDKEKPRRQKRANTTSDTLKPAVPAAANSVVPETAKPKGKKVCSSDIESYSDAESYEDPIPPAAVKPAALATVPQPVAADQEPDEYILMSKKVLTYLVIKPKKEGDFSRIREINDASEKNHVKRLRCSL